MTEPTPLPDHYAATVRALLRYAIVMAVVGLLSGISFQESSKKVEGLDLDPGTRLEATVHLALVHGHILVATVILPLVLGNALVLARRAGGRELSARPLRWLVWGYLPSVTASVVLMLYKGYHTLLSVRFGETDMAVVRGSLFGGAHGPRIAIYAVAHVAMAVSLCAFLWSLWRSLKQRRASASTES